MKYQVKQISYDQLTYQDIEECQWFFTSKNIQTDKGTLNIIGFQEVEQNGQVGVQMSVDGWLDLDKYTPFSPVNGPVNIRTLAIMRKPDNVWLWVYMFNENDQPVAAFCGTEAWDAINSFARYVNELKRMANGGVPDDLNVFTEDDTPESFIPSAEKRVKDCILADGKKYSGWGYFLHGQFVPHGCGKIYYPDFSVYGNFKEGELNGPAINSHNHYMYTMFFKGNRGNGWGLCINGGYLVEFGYYENSLLKTDLTDVVRWYYEGKLEKSERIGENMMSMYTSKVTNEVTNLLIGYAPQRVSENVTLSCMGFRFKADGSVWMGTGNLNVMTGNYIHFRPDGHIDIGRFEDSILTERTSLQELIDIYFGTYKINDESLFAPLLKKRPKSSFQLECESEREKYRSIDEPRMDFNYFTGEYEYSEEIPF